MDVEKNKWVLHIAGLGAVGSNLVNKINHNTFLKDKLEVYGWDYDKVEAHNCGNQFYSYGDIGNYKAAALHKRFPWVHSSCEPYSTDNACDILVMAVDTMTARRIIFHDRHADFCLDTRLADDVIISLTDHSIADNLDYNDDEVVQQSPCQSSFHADKKLVLKSVDWLIEQLESIVTKQEPAYKERRLIGGHVLEWGDTDVSIN